MYKVYRIGVNYLGIDALLWQVLDTFPQMCVND